MNEATVAVECSSDCQFYSMAWRSFDQTMGAHSTEIPRTEGQHQNNLGTMILVDLQEALGVR